MHLSHVPAISLGDAQYTFILSASKSLPQAVPGLPDGPIKEQEDCGSPDAGSPYLPGMPFLELVCWIFCLCTPLPVRWSRDLVVVRAATYF